MKNGIGRLVPAWSSIAVWLLVACGGGDGGGQQNPPAQNPPAQNPPPANTIGPAGGTVNGPNGSRVLIPAGALSQATAIAITASSAGAPALPAEVPAASQVFALTPHGTAFATPVTVTLPFDPLAVPANASTTVRKTNAAQSGWEPVAIQSMSGNEITVQATSFSWFYVGSTSPLPAATRGRIGGSEGETQGYSLARLANGLLLSWGSDRSEALGVGPGPDDRITPGPVSRVSDVVSISATGNSILALRTDGSVWGWGDNTFGALGRTEATTEATVDTPREIADVSATAICTSGGHSLFLQDDGTVLVLGTVLLADGTTEMHRSPVQVVGLEGVIAIDCRSGHSLALLRDGTLRAWGLNGRGQLGDGTTTNRHLPVPVVGLSNVIAIAVGGIHSLALLNDGSVWAWGSNHIGQLGDGAPGIVPLPPDDRSLVPIPTLANANIVAIAAGDESSMALRSDGTVFMWGANRYGQLGVGDLNNPGSTSTPLQVPGLTDVIEIALPGTHVMAARSDGTVWAWGANFVGQVGNGQQGPHVLSPQQVVGLDLD